MYSGLHNLPAIRLSALPGPFTTQPIQPGVQAYIPACGNLHHGRPAREVAKVHFSAREIEIIQNGQQINFGKKHYIRGTEHYGILGRFVVAFGN